MDHVAILDKKRKLLQKIISGEKTIESRWYIQKRVPWDNIKSGETIYFKDSGEPVSVRATVAEVRQFHLAETNILELLQKYGKDICFSEPDISKLVDWCSQRNYCILVRLENVQTIEPFEINKKGFGLMVAWITVDNVEKIISH